MLRNIVATSVGLGCENLSCQFRKPAWDYEDILTFRHVHSRSTEFEASNIEKNPKLPPWPLLKSTLSAWTSVVYKSVHMYTPFPIFVQQKCCHIMSLMCVSYQLPACLGCRDQYRMRACNFKSTKALKTFINSDSIAVVNRAWSKLSNCCEQLCIAVCSLFLNGLFKLKSFFVNIRADFALKIAAASKKAFRDFLKMTPQFSQTKYLSAVDTPSQRCRSRWAEVTTLLASKYSSWAVYCPFSLL